MILLLSMMFLVLVMKYCPDCRALQTGLFAHETLSALPVSAGFRDNSRCIVVYGPVALGAAVDGGKHFGIVFFFNIIVRRWEGHGPQPSPRVHAKEAENNRELIIN
jgi:hypothetical protein